MLIDRMLREKQGLDEKARIYNRIADDLAEERRVTGTLYSMQPSGVYRDILMKRSVEAFRYVGY
jgi:hypothetical protein